MRSPNTWICPGCGRTVVLPADCDTDGLRQDHRRLDQLAQALCGCWVSRLPSGGVIRFLETILDGSGFSDDQNLGFFAGEA